MAFTYLILNKGKDENATLVSAENRYILLNCFYNIVNLSGAETVEKLTAEHLKTRWENIIKPLNNGKIPK
jgi:hypothetical protein